MYFEEIVKYAVRFDVTNVTVANLGDIIEGLYMRNFNQPYEAEFTLSEQISKATKLLLDFITALSEYLNVDYFGIAGNHDRWFFDKNTIDGDNAMKVINESIKTVIEMSGIERVRYIEVDEGYNYEKVLEINGKLFKFAHGDLDSKSVDVAKHIAVHEQNIDCVITGHYHNYQMMESNYGKLHITNSSLMGRNNYSRKFKASSDASQTLVIVDDKNIIPIRVGLQYI